MAIIFPMGYLHTCPPFTPVRISGEAWSVSFTFNSTNPAGGCVSPAAGRHRSVTQCFSEQPGMLLLSNQNSVSCLGLISCLNVGMGHATEICSLQGPPLMPCGCASVWSCCTEAHDTNTDDTGGMGGAVIALKASSRFFSLFQILSLDECLSRMKASQWCHQTQWESCGLLSCSFDGSSDTQFKHQGY